MKKLTIFMSMLILAAGLAADAGDSRTLTQTVAQGSITTMNLDSGIGDVAIQAIAGADEITVEVVLTPRRGGFFSSKRRAEQDVEAATLSAKTAGDRLELTIMPEADDDRRFEENWTIAIPTGVAVRLNHGVGDIRVSGADAGVDIESGVGEVRVEVSKGDVSVELGVGTAVVRSDAAAFASAEGAAGVGDARLTVRGEKISSGGFVGHSANWEGDGASHIEVEVGVGDAVIRLD